MMPVLSLLVGRPVDHSDGLWTNITRDPVRARLPRMAARFLTLTDVTEVLNISMAQARALVRTGDLPAIQVGGRGVWRVESSQLEAYIERQYAQTRARTAAATGADLDDLA